MAIVPVSNKLGDIILSKHIAVIKKLLNAIHPGVVAHIVNSKVRNVPEGDGTIGFIGKEWKRKGLPKVVRIWRKLKKSRPNLKLSVAGPTQEEVQALFSTNEQDYELLGYVENKTKFFESIDVLLHPAKLEAFGMVITEALSFCVGTLLKECGHEIINEHEGKVLAEQSTLVEWVNSTNSILVNKNHFSYSRTCCLVPRTTKKSISN